MLGVAFGVVLRMKLFWRTACYDSWKSPNARNFLKSSAMKRFEECGGLLGVEFGR
jgi:hypothetical protein